MKLGKWERLILVGLLRDLDHWRNIDPEAASTREERGRRRGLHRNAQQGIAVVNLCGWLGRAPTPADSTQAGRATAALEAKGLLRRFNWFTGGAGRTTHVEVQAPSEAVARELLSAADVGRGAVISGTLAI